MSAFVREENFLIVYQKKEIFQRKMHAKYLNKSYMLLNIVIFKKLLIEILSQKIFYSWTNMNFSWKLLILDSPTNGKKTWTRNWRKKKIKNSSELYIYHKLVLLYRTWNSEIRLWWKMWYLVTRCHFVHSRNCCASIWWRNWQTNIRSCKNWSL